MTPDNLIANNLTLLSMPEIVIKLNAMLEDQNCSVTDIGNEISLEPALTIRVLKIVNSALYSLPKQVQNIPRAITILGLKQLRDIILTASVIKKFQSIPADLVNMDTFWRHSLSCAICCRNIADYCHLNDREDYFVMGLLHDIGKLVMYLLLPDQSREVLRKIRDLATSSEQSDHAEIANIEKHFFGFSHATLGRILTQQWNMSDSQSTPIAEHHLNYDQLTMTTQSSVLKIADHISNQIQTIISPDEEQNLDPKCLDILKLDNDKLIELQQQTVRLVEETFLVVYTNH